MEPKNNSHKLLGVTQSSAKMYEYHLRSEDHIQLYEDPAKLFILTVGMLGDIAANINREELSLGSLIDFRNRLNFSADFFDAYERSALNDSIDSYMLLLGAAAFYLCKLPGSTQVLALKAGTEYDDLGCDGIENLLYWVLQGNYETDYGGSEGAIGEEVEQCYSCFQSFFQHGTGKDSLIQSINNLRMKSYAIGTPRQLLLSDVTAAVIRVKIQNSSWTALPIYSNLDISQWGQVLTKPKFIKELWPGQHYLGQAGVLKGQSAIVQMPTSSGKTKAVELVIRSAFFKVASLAVIVAPFRALCHEIRDDLSSAFEDDDIEVEELSDAMIIDFELEKLFGGKRVVVVTPEKLLYLLRLSPELGQSIDLILFDEAHQFDSGKRGVVYELLLTSLRAILPLTCQKVLISAVISNAEEVGNWMNEETKVVSSGDLLPSSKSIGFVSWKDRLGSIEFVAFDDPDANKYFVPRVITREAVPKKKREKDRFFPERKDAQSIAIYLGLILVQNGGVAIFCGRKDSVVKTASKLVDVMERRGITSNALNEADKVEVDKLSKLTGRHLGHSSIAAKSAAMGVFLHHGNLPQGLRLSTEYAMREKKIKFVICTSTLAQGVNLPIQYLIFTGVRQGSDRIKARDFQNLIGRAGRAGMHVEGTVIFADPNIYDDKDTWNKKWRWEEAKLLLDPSNSEPCISNLTSLFAPLLSDDENTSVVMEALDFAKAFISDAEAVEKWAEYFEKEHGDKGFTKTGIERQILWRAGIISAIENFLISQWAYSDIELLEQEIVELAEGTLAFHLADEKSQNDIKELFLLLANNISASVKKSSNLKFFKRTLYGLRDSKFINEWLVDNKEKLRVATSEEAVFETVWPLVQSFMRDGVASKLNKPEALKLIATTWMDGASFNEILAEIQRLEVKLRWGTKFRNLTVEHVVELCENGFAFNGALLLGALINILEQEDVDQDECLSRLELILRRLKFGLSNKKAIALHEWAFPDRVVSQELALLELPNCDNKHELKKCIRDNEIQFREKLNMFPEYFQEKLDAIV